MPKLPAPSGVGRLSLRGFSDGVSEFVNVYHVKSTTIDPDDVEQCLELLDDLVSAFDGSAFYDGMIADAGVVNARLLMSNGTTAISVEQAVSTLNGADTGEHVDGSSACVISWRGSWSYRGGKPRTYLPGLSDEWFASPIQLDATHVVAQRTAALALIANVSALTGSYGSDVSLGALLGNTSSSAGTFSPFLTALVTQQIGHQRRRSEFN